MALQILFGDDEHTAKDGPYNRILRARKWLYLSAGASGILTLGHYDSSAANDLLKIISLPESLISSIIGAGLLYLLIQYCLLIFQLLVTYDIVLSERLSFRRADDLSAASDRLRQAREELSSFERNRRLELTGDYQELSAELARTRDLEFSLRTQQDNLDVRSAFPDPNQETLRSQVDAVCAERIRIEQRIKEASDEIAGRVVEPDDERSNLRYAAEEAAEALAQLKRQNPADRPGYALSERLIDLSRVLPPFIVGAISMYHLVHV